MRKSSSQKKSALREVTVANGSLFGSSCTYILRPGGINDV